MWSAHVVEVKIGAIGCVVVSVRRKWDASVVRDGIRCGRAACCHRVWRGLTVGVGEA